MDIQLTKAQRGFLEDYFEDILYGRPDLLESPDEAVLEALEGMDFDDGMATTSNRVKVARNLHEKGLLKIFNPHGGVEGPHIHLSFSRRGSEVVLQLLREAAAEGRLPQAKVPGI